MNDFLPFSTRIASAFLGAIITIATAIVGLFKFADNWYFYRSTATQLKRNIHTFMVRPSIKVNQGKTKTERSSRGLKTILSEELEKEKPEKTDAHH